MTTHKQREIDKMSNYRVELKSNLQRIYTTRGDNLVDHVGCKCDKAFALQFDGKLYWVNKSFGRFSELESFFLNFGVYLDEKGRYGFLNGSGGASLDERVTKIAAHHDDVFSSESFYCKKSVRASNSFWWDQEELINKFVK